jgi:hypothetical protein
MGAVSTYSGLVLINLDRFSSTVNFTAGKQYSTGFFPDPISCTVLYCGAA